MEGGGDQYPDARQFAAAQLERIQREGGPEFKGGGAGLIGDQLSGMGGQEDDIYEYDEEDYDYDDEEEEDDDEEEEDELAKVEGDRFSEGSGVEEREEDWEGEERWVVRGEDLETEVAAEREFESDSVLPLNETSTEPTPLYLDFVSQLDRLSTLFASRPTSRPTPSPPSSTSFLLTPPFDSWTSPNSPIPPQNPSSPSSTTSTSNPPPLPSITSPSTTPASFTTPPPPPSPSSKTPSSSSSPSTVPDSNTSTFEEPQPSPSKTPSKNSSTSSKIPIEPFK